MRCSSSSLVTPLSTIKASWAILIRTTVLVVLALAILASSVRMAWADDDPSDQGDASVQGDAPADADESDATPAETEIDEWLQSHPLGWGDDSYLGPSSADIQSPVVSSSVAKRLDAYLSMAFGKTHAPGLSVVVVDKDEVIYSNALGSVASADTPLIIGSLSKSYTGVGVMNLVQDGLVSLDAPVTDYLPDLDLGASVTIRQLLNQTSGLGTYQSVATARVIGPQGTFCYANVNYDLLGEVISTVSGETYEQYMNERVFEPLGLMNTYASLPAALAAGLAPGCRNWFGAYVEDGFTHATDEGAWGREPSGYIASSAMDMGRYLQMYLQGGEGILSPESCSAMFNDNVYDPSSDTYYGMGWTSYLWGMEIVQSHDGDVENYCSSMCLLPERGVGICLLVDGSDYTYGNYATYTLMGDLISIVMGNDPALEVTDGSATSQGQSSSDVGSQDGATQIGSEDDDTVGAGDDASSIEDLVMGTSLAQMDGTEYVVAHAAEDVAHLVFLLACGIPLVLARRWARCQQRLSGWRKVVSAIAAICLFAVLPIAVVLGAPDVLGMQWVEVWGFMPDMAATIIVGASLLAANGVARLAFLLGGPSALQR